jgi:hypothetical protein
VCFAEGVEERDGGGVVQDAAFEDGALDVGSQYAEEEEKKR